MSIFLLCIGICLLSYGIVGSFKKRQLIAIFPLSRGPHKLSINKPGFYIFSIKGAVFITGDMKINLVSEESTVIKMKAHFLRPRFKENSTISVQCWGASIKLIGEYSLQIDNLEKLKANGGISPFEGLFLMPLEANDLHIMVHKHIRPLTYVISIVGVVAGFWLILLALFRHQIFR
jgi:hypothetical protein